MTLLGYFLVQLAGLFGIPKEEVSHYLHYILFAIIGLSFIPPVVAALRRRGATQTDVR